MRFTVLFKGLKPKFIEQFTSFFLKGNFEGAPNLGILGNRARPQHRELSSLLFMRSTWIFNVPTGRPYYMFVVNNC